MQVSGLEGLWPRIGAMRALQINPAPGPACALPPGAWYPQLLGAALHAGSQQMMPYRMSAGMYCILD